MEFSLPPINETRQQFHSSDASATIDEAQCTMNMFSKKPYKSKISDALLRHNPSEERRLQSVLFRINQMEHQKRIMFEHSKRSFTYHQIQKGKQWKHDDESRISQMNFPYLHRSPTDAGLSAVTLYRAPHYSLTRKQFTLKGPVIPFVETCDESTSILEWEGHTVIQKVPSHVKTTRTLMDEHNIYCGQHWLQGDTPLTDRRFDGLQKSLISPNASTRWPTKFVFLSR